MSVDSYSVQPITCIRVGFTVQGTIAVVLNTIEEGKEANQTTLEPSTHVVEGRMDPIYHLTPPKKQYTCDYITCPIDEDPVIDCTPPDDSDDELPALEEEDSSDDELPALEGDEPDPKQNNMVDAINRELDGKHVFSTHEFCPVLTHVKGYKLDGNPMTQIDSGDEPYGVHNSTLDVVCFTDEENVNIRLQPNELVHVPFPQCQKNHYVHFDSVDPRPKVSIFAPESLGGVVIVFK